MNSLVRHAFRPHERYTDRRSRNNTLKLLPPQSPRGFSALASLYNFARPKIAMLRRLTSLCPTCNKALLDSFKQLFGPLCSVYYVLRVSSISLEQVLCTVICEGKSISKNPPSTTAIAVRTVNSLIATTSRKRPL